MPRLSPTDWQIQVKIFEKFGCLFVRQKGDHLIYHHPNANLFDKTIIKNNMNTVGMSREEYFRLLAEV